MFPRNKLLTNIIKNMKKKQQLYHYFKFLLRRMRDKYLFILVNFYSFMLFLNILNPIIVETFKLFMREHGDRLWRLYAFLVFIKIILFFFKNFFF